MANQLLPRELVNVLKKKKPTITQYIDERKIKPLLDLIEADDVLVENEVSGIQAEKTPHDKLSELVNCVTKGTVNHLKCFIRALEDGQVGCGTLAEEIKKSVLIADPEFQFLPSPEQIPAGRPRLPTDDLLSDTAKKALLKKKMAISKGIEIDKYVVILDMLRDEHEAIVQQEYDAISSPLKSPYEKAAKLIECISKGTINRLKNFLNVLQEDDVGCEALANTVKADILKAEPKLTGLI